MLNHRLYVRFVQRRIATNSPRCCYSCRATIARRSFACTPETASREGMAWRRFSSAESSSSDIPLAPPWDGDGKREDNKTNDEQEDNNNNNNNNRPRLSNVKITDVLKAKHSHRWVEPIIGQTATVRDGIKTAVEGGLSGMMVIEDTSRRVLGLITSRDLLRIMSSGIKKLKTADDIFNTSIEKYMTPISQVIYARPDETIGMCRTLMAKLGIKCLPILSRTGRVEGLITAKDMSDFGWNALDKGGKKSYLNNVSERVGLLPTTSMADPPNYLKAHLALEQAPLFVNVGSFALPHPFKTPDGRAGRSQRDVGIPEPSKDNSLSEDASFVATVQFPDEHSTTPEQTTTTTTSTTTTTTTPYTYIGVADGVGSWREYGVDARLFSHTLMAECERVLHEATSRHVLSPAKIMAQSYERVKRQNIIGSSTACIALFDGLRHQLHFSNLGDSGLIVLRHIDSDVAGALRREKKTPRTERKSDLRLNFVSQQQLRSFNHPYQLGWTGEEIPDGEKSSFREARDACTSSIHLRRGDIVIMATDGLFDNVDTDQICSIALQWEQTNGFIRAGDIKARERRWSMGNSLSAISSERIGGLAEELVKKARENSLNKEIDSPFAILAKENDIMWSGGMPDDCTCVCLHVTGVSTDDAIERPNM